MSRPGFVHYATFPEVTSADELVESLGILVDHGFEVIECSSRLDPDLLGHAARFLQQRGVDMFLSAGPEFIRTPHSLCAPNDAMRQHSLARARELVHQTADLGAKNLMLVSGADPWVEQRPEATAHLIESLREIADVARVRGVRVTIETFPRSRPPGQLLGPTSVALAVLEEVGAAELGLTIDLSHLVQLHEDVAESAQALATRSRHVHLSTCVMDFGHPLEGDQHPSFAETGIALSVEAAAHALTPLRDRVDVVSVEIRRHHAEPAEQFIPACASWWQTATGQVLRGPGG